ncbi:hypothetical protein COU53_03345 [Candidatus Pacearchaeota archaeon CG10_big_fil_rev_8_21_14_0_10_30_48]|nr:MAG: hypothetical protein COU53_03345 [Candidatus Pacearchaeota archaeon CG10_big_fil_rev_8_21_14_0_10_30_48]
MNKKAQIGTTLTWVVAMTIIIFILILFILGILFTFGNKTLTDLKIPSSEIELKTMKSLDFSNTKNLISFLDNHETLISRWADSDVENYQTVCDVFKEGGFDLNGKTILFEVGDPAVSISEGNKRTILIEDAGGVISCAPSDSFFYNSQIISHIIFPSDKQNLIEVTYAKQ